MDTLVTTLLAVLGIYVLMGLLFAVPFVFAGAKRIDPPAGDTGLGFKLLILPGSMVFWPLLLKRWIKRTPPSEETSAHRSAAKPRALPTDAN